MTQIHFLLICEGSSDEGLVRHLEKLCVECGASEVSGVAPDLTALRSPPGRRVDEKVRAAIRLEPGANLIFVHRDSDSPDPTPRIEEISRAMSAHGVAHVPVVPVQETEAWLLLDERAIRIVAANPKGRIPLDLPKPSRVEQLASPKERLQEALILASELSGRRLKKFRRLFPQQRASLLSRLDMDGPVATLPAYKRMKQATRTAVAQVATV